MCGSVGPVDVRHFMDQCAHDGLNACAECLLTDRDVLATYCVCIAIGCRVRTVAEPHAVVIHDVAEGTSARQGFEFVIAGLAALNKYLDERDRDNQKPSLNGKRIVVSAPLGSPIWDRGYVRCTSVVD